MHLNGLWGCLCLGIGAARSIYVMWSEMCPLLPQNNAVILGRAPKRAYPDQPTALSLASAGDRNLDVCACFLGSMWIGDQVLSCDVLWALYRSFEHIYFIKTNCPNTPILTASKGQVGC